MIIKKLKIFYKIYKLNLRRIVIICATGILYYTWLKLTGIGIPCIIHLITGLYCPGCGNTHFVIDILNLNFKKAFRDNAASAILLPVWLLYLIIIFIKKIINPNAKLFLFNIIIFISCIILILFGIIRNIPGFEFLLPEWYF